ncbi:MAG: integrase [Gammaproteobacteria bacterium HGW-Gammaproteobacteria-3]|nr:MAG: integrase [Gammaproteobacteria bacterium HGW-Gammaproteobacteria-3]
MEHRSPAIEFINDSTQPRPPVFNPTPWFRSRRFVIFMAGYLLCALVGLIINYSRPAIYQSSATLLTSAMTAIDQVSDAADIQHVAIQRQILLGQELLDETLSRLNSTHPANQLGIAAIRQMLQVKSVSETNLVEMSAEGPQPEILSALINTLIDVYLDARAADIAQNKDRTTENLRNELHDLDIKIEAARQALNQFRNQHDITSTQRDENTALTRLKGLTTALNNASEEEVKAKARLDAVNNAIARGQAVVPTQDQRSLADLEKRLQNLREKLAEFDRRYTREYMALQPQLKYIPREIKNLEHQIEQMRDYGKNIVQTDAEQNYEAARQAVQQIRLQLEEHKQQAAEFSARFAEHETLQTDLAGLEAIYRQTQERLVQIETQNADRYPQVSVIERAFLPLEPVRPHYGRDTLLVLAGSVLFGLFCVWIAEFLTRQPPEPQPGLTLSGLHVYKDIDLDRLKAPQTQTDSKNLPQDGNRTLAPPPQYRELSDTELQTLIAATNSMGRQLIGLLLSGLTLEEAAALNAENFDLSHNTIEISGSNPRVIRISEPLAGLFARYSEPPIWRSPKSLSVNDLGALISLAAINAGLPYSEGIDAETIRHTYIIYLVRQGLRLTELPKLVGNLAPAEQLSYKHYSPPSPGFGSESIECIHPAMNNDAWF